MTISLRGSPGRLVGVVLVLLATSACRPEAGPMGERTFDDLFRPTRSVALDEHPEAPIVGVSHLAVLDDGDFVVTDGAGSRVWRFGPDGSLRGAVGRPGRGPGELSDPTAAAPGPDGRVWVVERASPRVTVFGSDGSHDLYELPGFYGHWIGRAGERMVVGVGTPEDRFAVLAADGESLGTFAPRPPELRPIELWAYLVREHAAVAGDEIVVNSSFEPELRVYGLDGDSVRSFGEPPPGWQDAELVEEGFEGPGADARLERWLRSFTVVTAVAAVEDSLVVVQYGAFDPTPSEARRIVPRSVDVYHVDGRKLAEEVPLGQPVLKGGDRLYTLAAEPPEPWTIGTWEWVGGR